MTAPAVSEPATQDNTPPVTDAEFKKGMIISVAIGLYYVMNALMPIVAWYGWRRVPTRSLHKTNKIYIDAWYMLYAAHFIVYLPMAFMWPFTYSG